MPLFITVEALHFAVAGAVSLMGLLSCTEVCVIFGKVALATLEALDCVMWHQALVGYVAQLVASATLGKRGPRDPLAEGNRFAKHGKVGVFHGLHDLTITVHKSEGNGGVIAGD